MILLVIIYALLLIVGLIYTQPIAIAGALVCMILYYIIDIIKNPEES